LSIAAILVLLLHLLIEANLPGAGEVLVALVELVGIARWILAGKLNAGR
jgi:hypothetical protein